MYWSYTLLFTSKKYCSLGQMNKTHCISNSRVEKMLMKYYFDLENTISNSSWKTCSWNNIAIWEILFRLGEYYCEFEAGKHDRQILSRFGKILFQISKYYFEIDTWKHDREILFRFFEILFGFGKYYFFEAGNHYLVLEIEARKHANEILSGFGKYDSEIEAPKHDHEILSRFSKL